jgi:hypothetical protein
MFILSSCHWYWIGLVPPQMPTPEPSPAAPGWHH